MRVVAFCGPKGCGKDAAASALLGQNNNPEGSVYFERMPFAAGVKRICGDFFGWTMNQMDDGDFKETPRALWEGGPVMAPRWPMMDIANWMRDKYGPEIHAQRLHRNLRAANRLRNGLCFVNTDLRFPPEELDMLKKVNALVIYVFRPSAEDALKAKRASGDQMALNVSESHYDTLAEYCYDLENPNTKVVVNDKALYNLHNEVLGIVNRHFGHWKYWAQEDSEKNNGTR